jgi:hypothetical protein
VKTTKSMMIVDGREEIVGRGWRSTPGPSGLGGWLVLPIVGLVLTPVATVLALFRYALPALEAANWARFTDPTSGSYVKIGSSWPRYGISLLVDAWSAYFTFEMGVTIAWLVVPMFLLTLFFRKKRAFPWFMVLCTLAVVLVRFVEMSAMARFGADTFLKLGFPQTADQLRIGSAAAFAASVTVAAISVPYFLRSRRVKNTFVRE